MLLNNKKTHAFITHLENLFFWTLLLIVLFCTGSLLIVVFPDLLNKLLLMVGDPNWAILKVIVGYFFWFAWFFLTYHTSDNFAFFSAIIVLALIGIYYLSFGVIQFL